MPQVQLSQRVGTRLADKYQIIRVIGEGGMGAVFEARHVQMDRRVAIKMLHPQYVQDRDAVERFLREARSAAAIVHKNIVQILDFGEAEDGAPFIVMAYLDGQTLADRLYQRGRLSEVEAVQVLTPIVNALERAHQRGIIHRDLKPENVFMARDSDGRERPVLVDFGVSKFHGEAEMNASSKHGGGTVLGTPAYMSPEQATGRGLVDARTDIYSMGVMLYELLTGYCPFQREDYALTLQAILNETVRPPSQIVPSISPAMEAVVLCAMARDPQQRFPSMEELQHALHDVVLEPNGSSFLMRHPLARMILVHRAASPPPGEDAAPAGAEIADKSSRTMMIVVGNGSPAEAPPPRKEQRPLEVIGGPGVILALLVFLGGVAMLAFALISRAAR
jgi:serine/threonine-protein kinase